MAAMAALLPSIVPGAFGRQFDQTPYSSRGSACRVAALSSHSDYPAHPTYRKRRNPSGVSCTSTRSSPVDFHSLNDENKEPLTIELSQPQSIRANSLSHNLASKTVVPSLSLRENKATATEFFSAEDLPVLPGKTVVLKRSLDAAHSVPNEINQADPIETDVGKSPNTDSNAPPRYGEKDSEESVSKQFSKWADSFRKRKTGVPRVTVRPRRDGFGRNMNFYGSSIYNRTFPLRRTRLRKSTSLSSSGFVETVKTASFSTSSLDLPPLSLRNSELSSGKGNRDSIVTASYARFSTESDTLQNPSLLDEGARCRAVRRRQILDELLVSEESYVADLKVLTDLFSTILTSLPSVSRKMRSSIHHNVMTILHLHDAFVYELHQSAQRHASSAADFINDRKQNIRRHKKWHSLDCQARQAEDGHSLKVRNSIDVPRRPQEAAQWTINLPVAQGPETAEVARIAKRLTSHFFAYEEYCSKYDMMMGEIGISQRLFPAWPAYESGVEALARSMSALDARSDDQRKGLTVGDLLIKPVQRLCRYPLLFADLHKYTPVIDCPVAHMELESTLGILQDSVQVANKVMDDSMARKSVQRTWLLRERLIFFHEQVACQDQLCKLGHVKLCGVLHATYQTRSRVRGEYLVCVSFSSHLLLARSSRISDKFDVVAIISLGDSKVESTEDGKGLQCHNALHSWKLVFESECNLYELMFSACSAVEEEQWRKYLRDLSVSSSTATDSSKPHKWPPERLTTLMLDLKSLGPVYGHADSFARRLSIQRAATVGTRSATCQVIIRHTANLVEGEDQRSDIAHAINRSQSLLSTHRVSVLAPKRSERIRLEHCLSDVWSRDIIPFPGMTANRGGNIIRASAGSLVRRLSRASMHGPFSRRSTSITVIPSRTSNEENRELRDDDLLANAGSRPHIGEAHRRTKSNTENNNYIRNDEEHKEESRRMSTGNAGIQPTDRNYSKSQSAKAMVENEDRGVCERLIVEEKLEAKKRWSNPLSLLKNISTDSMRHFLYSSKTT